MIKKEISRKSVIGNIIKDFPNCADILLSEGLQCISCSMGR